MEWSAVDVNPKLSLRPQILNWRCCYLFVSRYGVAESSPFSWPIYIYIYGFLPHGFHTDDCLSTISFFFLVKVM